MKSRRKSLSRKRRERKRRGKVYSVKINNQGGSSFSVASKDYEFNVDTKGAGITPPDTLLASYG